MFLNWKKRKEKKKNLYQQIVDHWNVDDRRWILNVSTKCIDWILSKEKCTIPENGVISTQICTKHYWKCPSLQPYCLLFIRRQLVFDKRSLMTWQTVFMIKQNYHIQNSDTEPVHRTNQISYLCWNVYFCNNL